ncbi:MAG TPA: cation diffusion facilitator family transporter [Methylomirabilota bacterium]
MESESRTAVIAALLGNAALVVLKGIAAVATGSAAMVAETFHSVADTGNQALLLLGQRHSRRPPDETHPFGYGRSVYFWAFVVSVMLFTVGGAASVGEAVRTYLHPHEQESFAWAYGVLAGAFVFEGISLVVGVRMVRRVQGMRPFTEFWRDSRDPTLLTVLLEDSAALASIVIAAGGIAIGQATGNPQWDAAASAIIGLILLTVAVLLAFETYSLLLGETAPPEVQQRIRRIVLGDPAVAALASLHTMHLGPEALLMAVGVQFRDELTAGAVTAAVSRIQEKIRAALGDATTARMIVIEPTPPPVGAPSSERRPRVA